MEKIIKQKLERELNPSFLEIIDESTKHVGHAGFTAGQGTHFKIKIVSPSFRDMGKVERHRMVHHILEDELRNQIHALSLVLLSPDESNRSA